MQNTKNKVLLAIVSVAIIAAGLCTGLSTKADKPQISSKGNFIFKDSEASIYADDIYYLHSEIVKLFNEIQ